MEKQKKPTNAQLQKRIANAIIHVDRTKDTQSIFFDDKGLRLTVNEEYAIIETGYHRHVFNNFTSDGVCRPYLYTKRIIEIANDNNAWVKDEGGNLHYSYKRLMEVLKEKEDKNDYNIATYYDWWLFIIFNNLYAIAENEASYWLVFFKYVQALATNTILLEEHKEDLTNKAFIEKFKSLIDDFTKDIDERVVFHKLTDEEYVQGQIDAIAQFENEEIIKENIQKSQESEN